MSTSRSKRPSSFGRHWTAKEDSLLGVESDRTLARRFGRTVQAVAARRRLKRITLCRFWTPQEEKLLGTRPDREVAKLVGRGTQGVNSKRCELGIPCLYERPPWTAEHLALLGRKPDEEVVILTGHTLSAIRMRRWLLRRPNPAPLPVYWTPEQDQLLGKLPDREVARLTGRTLAGVGTRRHKFKIKPCEAALAAQELVSRTPANLLRRIDEVVGGLPESDRALLARRFGATGQGPQSVMQIAQQDGASRAWIWFRLDRIIRWVCRQESLNPRSLLDCVDGISTGSRIPLSPAPVSPRQAPAAGFRYPPQLYALIIAKLRSAARLTPAGRSAPCRIPGPGTGCLSTTSLPPGAPPDYICIPEHLKSKPIAAFRLPARLRHLLQYTGIRLLGDLDGKRLSDFADYRGCGEETLRALRHLLLRALHRRTPTRSRAKSA